MATVKLPLSENSCNKSFKKQPRVLDLPKLVVTDSQAEEEQCNSLQTTAESTPQSESADSGKIEFKHNISTTSFESGYGSKRTSASDNPGHSSSPFSENVPIVVEETILNQDVDNCDDQESVSSVAPMAKSRLSDKPQLSEHLDEKDSPVRRKRICPTCGYSLPPKANYRPFQSVGLRRSYSFSDSSPRERPRAFTSLGGMQFLSLPLNDVQLPKAKTKMCRKKASELSKNHEKNLKETVQDNMKEFVSLTDFVILMACLSSKRLICTPDAEYLTSKCMSQREKANYYYMVILPKKGRKAYRLLYESLSEECEHRGHRQLLHILDKAVSYVQNSSSESSSYSSSPGEMKRDENVSSCSESADSIPNYSSRESLNESHKSLQSLVFNCNDPLKATSDD